jgi:hypothetical protein
MGYDCLLFKNNAPDTNIADKNNDDNNYITDNDPTDATTFQYQSGTLRMAKKAAAEDQEYANAGRQHGEVHIHMRVTERGCCSIFYISSAHCA